MINEKESVVELIKRDPQLKIRFNESLNIINTLRGNLDILSKKERSEPEQAALRFLEKHADLFGDIEKSTLSLLKENNDPHRGLDLIFQQSLGLYKVLSGIIRFHWNPEGTLTSVTNRLFPDLDKIQKPKIDETEAFERALKATKAKGELEEKLILFIYRFEGRPRLAYDVRINDEKIGSHGAPSQWVVFIDAVNGEVLLLYDNVQTAGAVIGNGTGYYSGAGNINTFYDDTTYQLRDTTRVVSGGPEVQIDDEDGASPSEDADNNWNDLTTVPRDENQGVEVDSHRYTAAVFEYYNTVHGRNSFDDAGSKMNILVHYGTDLNNGYWDGAKVKLGDGDGVQSDYCTTDDWLAHEFTHAYTQHTCGLLYSNESGALNEAFSDIFSAFITGDWLIFEDSWLLTTAPASRNMIDPTNGGSWDLADPINSVLAGHQPSHYSQRYTGTGDYGGVHINSGIINNLFYLLTLGGTHAESGVTVAGIGQSAAEQMLFRCMTINLVGNSTANFIDFREAMLDACQDLFPIDLSKLTQVKNAFHAVGIGPDLYVRDNVSDNGIEPYSGSYLYASPDIINRTSPSADPSIDFSNMNDDALWQKVEFGQDNYVYVRVQNRGDSEGDATINVFFSSATTFGTPSSWIHIGTLLETGIIPGEVRISGYLTFPEALIPSVGHYCMIAVISDPLDPAPDHNLIVSVSDYLDFVRNTNNIAYRNMDVVDLVPGSPGVIDFEVGTVGLNEQYQLEFDLGKAPQLVQLRIHGPREVLDGSKQKGLKLIARKNGMNIYKIDAFKSPMQRGKVHRYRTERSFRYGFDGLLLDKPTRFSIEFLLPRKIQEMHKRLFNKRRHQIRIIQRFKGKEVGAFTARFHLK